MKLKYVMGTLLALSFSQLLTAAQNVPQDKETITKDAMRAHKKALVAHNMNLTPDQEKIFWPMYDDYQIQINRLMADREALIKKFSINFNSMSDEMAQELMDDEIGLEKKEVDVRKNLVGTFSKSFPAKIVA